MVRENSGLIKSLSLCFNLESDCTHKPPWKKQRENEIINRDGKAIDLHIYYVEEQHKHALHEVDKQAATKLLSASRASNLRVMAYREYYLALRNTATFIRRSTNLYLTATMLGTPIQVHVNTNV